MPEIEQQGPHNWSIKNGEAPDANIDISLSSGDILFIVGANGTGKSALLESLYKTIPSHKKRVVSGHRQIWLGDSAISLTASDRKTFEANIIAQDRNVGIRYKEWNPGGRLSALLFDLVAADNARYRKIGGLVDDGVKEKAEAEALKNPSPISTVNELLALGTLTVSISNNEGEELQAKHGDGDPFKLEKVSDGERNAVFLIAQVLLAKDNDFIIIDEPERHLHRSIMEPLLTALFAKKPKCTFVVATHELSLPTIIDEARTIIPRRCHWVNDTATWWDIDILDSDSELPEELKTAVLGSRSRMLFVEGDKTRSLDLALYGLLLPNVTIKPVGGYKQVLENVRGLNSAQESAWVSAFGLIDGDGWSEEHIEGLKAENIFALPVHSVEALYYSEIARTVVAQRQSETIGEEPQRLLDKARAAALNLFTDAKQKELAAKRCQQMIRDQILTGLPNWKDLLQEGEITVSGAKNIKELFATELSRMKGMVDGKDLDGLIMRYKVREAGILKPIALSLGFTDRTKYEQAVLTKIRTDEETLTTIRDLIGPVYKAVSA